MSAHEKWMKIGLSASQTNFRTSSESCVRSPVLCLRSAFLLSWTVSSVRPDSLCMPMTETFQTEISWNWSLLSTEHHSIPGQVCVRLCITPYHSWNDALLTLNLYRSSIILKWSASIYLFIYLFFLWWDLPVVISWWIVAPYVNFYCITTHTEAIYKPLYPQVRCVNKRQFSSETSRQKYFHTENYADEFGIYRLFVPQDSQSSQSLYAAILFLFSSEQRRPEGFICDPVQ